MVSPTHPLPALRFFASLLATANCWLNDLQDDCTCPPNTHVRSAPRSHPGKDAALNLNTNHQSTGCPAARRGIGCPNSATCAEVAVASLEADGVVAAARLRMFLPHTNPVFP